MKRILIIGYGSIGKKHANILREKFKNISIFIFSKRKIPRYFNKIESLNNIKNYKFQYVYICSKTNDHILHLKIIDSQLKNVNIVIEKPLFKKFYNYKSNRNKILVAYNLRFHPVLKFIKNFIKNKNIFFINIYCGSYLPDWKKNINYINSYSSSKKDGGGVLLDLSHEIDYLTWIFGKINKIDYVDSNKISNLNINSDDHLIVAGNVSNVKFIINMNYYSKINERFIKIYGANFTLKGDLISNKVEIHNKKKIIKKFKLENNFTYIQEHKFLFRKKFKLFCNLNEGKYIMKIIDKLKNN
jgi:CMP-N,N'-diacetyllegionaminic acid synthase